MTRFLLLGHHRSGTTLLTLALRRHSDVRMFGEILGSEEDMDPLWLRKGARGDRFLESVFRSAADCLAVGFKALYGHAQDSLAATTAWNYLSKDPAVRIIHLKRARLFESLVSLKLAERTQTWHTYDDSPAVPNHAQLFIAPGECLAYFDRIRRQQDWVSSTFYKQDRLELEYESDLVRRYAQTLERVADFLQVRQWHVPPQLRKMGVRPLHQVVINYDELIRTFDGTPFISFFPQRYADHAPSKG
jgi:hypothetical protein